MFLSGKSPGLKSNINEQSLLTRVDGFLTGIRLRRGFLTRRDCQSLLEMCRPDLRDLALGALYTGCRISELVQLRVQDVNEPGFTINLPVSQTGETRTVYVADEGMVFFMRLCRSRDQGDQLFLHQSGNSWTALYKYCFGQAVKSAGLPEKTVFHSLRRTYAIQLLRAGTAPALVAQQLGHMRNFTSRSETDQLPPDICENEIRRRFRKLDHQNSESAKLMRYELELLHKVTWPGSR